jgi:hypothetical protein
VEHWIARGRGKLVEAVIGAAAERAERENM